MGCSSSLSSEATTSGRLLRVVAITSRTGRYGGPSDTASRQVRVLRESGVSAQLLAGFYRGDCPPSAGLAPGRYVAVASPRHAQTFILTFSLRMAIATVQEVLKAESVHVSFAREPVPLWAAVVALTLNRRLILQPHGMLTARTSLRHRAIDLLLIRPIVRRASVVLVLSDAEARALREWNGAPLPPTSVLGNPLPPQVAARAAERTVPDQDQIRLVFIARLHPRKRVEDFLAAAAMAEYRGFPWHWVVVGPDDGDAEVVRHAANRGGLLHYAGPVSAGEVVEQLDRSTIFVMPSENEPWGNVLASALALGIPSIVTRSAALAASVEAFGAGRAVPDHDPEAILEAAIHLTHSDHYAAASRGAGRLRDELLDPGVLRRRLVALAQPTFP